MAKLREEIINKLIETYHSTYEVTADSILSLLIQRVNETAIKTSPFPKSDKPIDVNNPDSFGYANVNYLQGANSQLDAVLKMLEEKS